MEVCMIKKLKQKVKRLKDFVLKGERVFDNFNNASMQVVLKNQYKIMKTMDPSCLPQFSEVGFSAYSQFEDIQWQSYQIRYEISHP